jgi:regulator of replication initiation timing
MNNWIKKIYKLIYPNNTKNYPVYFLDEITGINYNGMELINSMSSDIEDLKTKYDSLLVDIKKLQEENIELTNSLYEFENRLESKIDNIHPVVYNLNNKTLEDFTLGDS